MNNILNTEISNIQFLNKRQIYLFNKYYNIYSYKDFIYYSPIKYIDRRTFTKICFINKNVYFVQFKCIITRKKIINNNKILYVYGKDDTGEIPLIWFRGIHKMNCFIKLNLQYIVFGKVNIYNDNISIIHPEIDNIASYTKKYQNSSYTPIYKIKSQSKYIKINSNVIKKIQLNIINIIRNKIKDTLSEYIIYKYNLCSFFYAIKNLHFPINNKAILISKYRLKFEELFNMHKNILLKKEKNKKNNIAYSLNKIGDLFNKFYKKYLPFELTNAQKKVIKEIRRDLNSEIQMNRLLQGDVGCGKTIVALMIMLIAIDNKTQTCLMVPSELLAEQHFNFIKNILNKLPVNIELITSSISKKKKIIIVNELYKGNIDILIGTHSILSDDIQFKKLGLAIIDEQHRFGVNQRKKLWNKNSKLLPHTLIMTATPIPRTLAMTLYGDLDVSIIDDMPQKRLVKTIHCYDYDRERVFNFIYKEILNGYQVYIIYPIIGYSQKTNLKSLLIEYNKIIQSSILHKCRISILHGNMGYKSKIKSMNDFLNKKSDIMIATTAIEVGIHIPNVSVILIENSEQFGLSQLHQLRGRIGRNSINSYCILMTSKTISQKAKMRINTMKQMHNGFDIANVDLKIRGPGNFSGIEQSGMIKLKIANLYKDINILSLSKEAAHEYIMSKKN